MFEFMDSSENNLSSTYKISDVDLSNISIMEYNILFGGLGSEWKDVIKKHNPDILIAIETQDWEGSKINSLISEFNSYFSEEDPYVGYCTTDTTSIGEGQAILSRFPIEDFIEITDGFLDNGDPANLYRVIYDAIVDIGGTDVHIFGLHLKCCEGDYEEEMREKDTEIVMNYMDTLGDVPIIFSGDLNCFSPYDGLTENESNLGTEPIRMLLDDYGLIDTFKVFNPHDPGHTYGHTDPMYDSRIDFILTSHHFSRHLLSSQLIPENGSDHYPIEMKFDFSGSLGDYYAPEIDSEPEILNIRDTSVTLFWNTNETSNTVVEYTNNGQDLPFDNLYINNGNPYNGTTHFATLSGLSPNTKYWFRACSYDWLNNGPTWSSINNFTTDNMDIVINELYPNSDNEYALSQGNDSGFDNLIFTEVLYDAPNNDGTEEWIEIYNPTNNVVSLDGWSVNTIADPSWSFPFLLSGSIGIGEYYVIAKDLAAFQNLYPGVVPDILGCSIGLRNSGDLLIMRNSAGNVIDIVGWEMDEWDSLSAYNDVIKRYTLSDNDNTSDWRREQNYGNPKTGYLSHTYTSDRDEYFIIYNPADMLVNISGWSIFNSQGKIKFSEDNVILEPYESIIITADNEEFYNSFGINADYEWNATWNTDQNNSIIPDMIVIEGNFELQDRSGELILDNEEIDSDNKSIDIVLWNNYESYIIPEKSYKSSVAPSVENSQALRRVIDGDEGYEVNENDENLTATFVIVEVSLSSPPRIVNRAPFFTDIPNDITFIEGETGQSLTWEAIDQDNNEATYNIYVNSELIVSEKPWIENEIVYSLDDLEVGVNNITIVLFDSEGLMTKNTVYVTVEAATVDSSSTTTNDKTNNTSWSDLSIILSVFIILPLLKRKKK